MGAWGGGDRPLILLGIDERRGEEGMREFEWRYERVIGAGWRENTTSG